jgi:CDGSH-type Zn-finger protein
MRTAPHRNEVSALAANFPSGAITYEPVDGSAGERAPVVNVVHIRENGPLALHAPLEIAGQDAGFRATLCRCGALRHKPFCDGSHRKIGFTAD